MEGHGSEVQGKRSNYPASLRSFYQTGMTESISESTLDANLDNSDEWSMAVVLNSSPGDPCSSVQLMALSPTKLMISISCVK